MSASAVPAPAVVRPLRRLESPGARLLREHSEICNQCHLVGLMHLKPEALCRWGFVLYVAAKRRARAAGGRHDPRDGPPLRGGL